MKREFEFRQYWSLAVLALVAFCAPVARGGTLDLVVGSAIVPQGTTQASLEIWLFNGTSSAVNIAGFNWEISVGTTDITFDYANQTTSPDTYIFVGDSFDVIAFSDPVISDDMMCSGADGTPPSSCTNQFLQGSDITYDSTNITVNPNDTFALGEVFFDVAPGATLAGDTVTLNTDPAATNLADLVSPTDSESVPFNPVNGTITVISSGAPEPGTMALAVFGIAALVTARRNSRRQV